MGKKDQMGYTFSWGLQFCMRKETDYKMWNTIAILDMSKICGVCGDNMSKTKELCKNGKFIFLISNTDSTEGVFVFQ